MPGIQVFRLGFEYMFQGVRVQVKTLYYKLLMEN
jgi:hypothetical protein